MTTATSDQTPRGGRRTALAVAVCLIAALALSVAACGGEEDDGPERVNVEATGSDSRANVIWLMTDDQEEDSMRVMPKTRRLIGDRGVTFTESITSWPLCCPSRATLQSGQYAHNHEVLENRPPIGGYDRFDNEHALPVWLQEAGYTTVGVGKYMNDYDSESGVPPGWDEWYGLVEPSNRYFKPALNENGEIVSYGTKDEDYSTDLFTSKATEFIEGQADSDEPFFISVGYVAPHVGNAFVTEKPRCDANGPEPAPRHEDEFADARIPRTPNFNEDDVSDKPRPIRKLPKVLGKLLREKEDRYGCRLATLLAVDDGVAEIVDALRRTGELENTYIFFTSDNGYLQGEHRLKGGKSVMYEGSLHVPLLVRGPHIPAGAESTSAVSNVDWAPTILDIAGAEADHTVDGQSILSLAEHPDVEQGPALLIESARERYNGVHTPRYVLADYYGGGSIKKGGGGPTFKDKHAELYDLAKDPYQLENVADDPSYEQVRADLERLIERLKYCDGAECDGAARVEVTAERAGGGADDCRADRARIALSGPDAELVSRVEVQGDGAMVSAEGPEGLEIAAPSGRAAEYEVRVELRDGRISTLFAELPGCDGA